MKKKVEKPKFANSSWNFELDEVQTYSFWNNAFTKEECEKIVKIGKNKGLTTGTTFSLVNDVRKSNISWLYPSDDMEWVFRKVTDIVLNLNSRFFQFDLFGVNEGFQFTNYVAPSDKYGKHVDRAINIPVRKLSVSIQLTNPDEY